MPEVIVAKTAGFCFGVSRAIDMVETELDKPGSQVCTLGPIVHNETVTDELASRGVKAIEAPEEAAPGSTVVIRAHGVAESVEETLKNQGIKVVDATCPFVSKIHEIVKRESERGAVVIIVGNPDHPEVKGIAGRCSGIYHVVDSFEDFEKLKLPLDKKKTHFSKLLMSKIRRHEHEQGNCWLGVFRSFADRIGGVRRAGRSLLR